MPKDRPVTLSEIAKKAGVHVSTVSRALAKDTTGVGERTVVRIRGLATELGYRPDPAATSLRTGKTFTLGVLMPRLTDYVIARIFEGIDTAAQERGYTALVAGTGDDADHRVERLEKLLGRRVDGVIVADARLDGDELIQALRRRRVPYALVNRRVRGHPAATTDDINGGRLAGQHLIDLGHTRVGVIAGPDFASTCVERTHGFVERFMSAGIAVPDSCIQPSTPDAEGGYRIALQLLDENPYLTGLFAINDVTAIGAMGAARDRGRVPGRDIAIIGYNDIPLARLLPVPLTSVAAPIHEMGYAGANLLMDSVEGRHSESVLLEPELIVRASTADVVLPAATPHGQRPGSAI